MKIMKSLLVMAIIALALGQSDISSFSNIDTIIQRNIDAKFAVEFNDQVVVGQVDITFQAIQETRQIILDTNGLTIISIVDVNLKPLKWYLDSARKLETLGTPLVIQFDTTINPGDMTYVEILYMTSPNAPAVQWLTPEMTMGKKYPFMYTQGEAILGRSLLPCQDTPSAKVNFKGMINVTNPLIGLIAGIQTKVEPSSDDTTNYYYETPLPIATYLITLAVGALEQRKMGDRTLVWGEEEIVDAAAKEFEDAELYISTVFIMFKFRWKSTSLPMNGSNMVSWYYLLVSLTVVWRTLVLLS
jgi:leukotriene-A4 hydrolase